MFNYISNLWFNVKKDFKDDPYDPTIYIMLGFSLVIIPSFIHLGWM